MIYKFPTDTVYGIGAPISRTDLIEQIYQTKGRDISKPMAVLCDNLTQVYKLVDPEDFEKGRKYFKYWPGPLTIIFKKNKNLPYEYFKALDTIAIRIPNNTTALSLVKENGPMVTTSLNLSGEEPITNYTDASNFGGPGILIRGEEPLIGHSSTIINTDGKIFRKGSIKFE